MLSQRAIKEVRLPLFWKYCGNIIQDKEFQAEYMQPTVLFYTLPVL